MWQREENGKAAQRQQGSSQGAGACRVLRAASAPQRGRTSPCGAFCSFSQVHPRARPVQSKESKPHSLGKVLPGSHRSPEEGCGCVGVSEGDLARTGGCGQGSPAELTASRDGALGEGSGNPVCGAWRVPGTRSEVRWGK